MFRIISLFLLFTFLVFTTFVTAQEADQDQAKFTDEEMVELIEDSIRVQIKELTPIQKEHGKRTGKLSQKASDAHQLIHMLEEEKPDKLKRIRDEMENLSRRMALLEKAEEVLTDMDEAASEKTVSELKTTIEEIKKQSRDLNQPYSERIAEVHRNYSDLNEEFGAAFAGYFKDAAGDFVAYSKKRTYGNYAVATVGASWNTESRKERVSINIALHQGHNWKPRNPKFFMEKYPIAHEGNNNLSFIVADRMRITIQGSGSIDGKKPDLRKFVTENLDIDALEKLIEQVEPAVADP